MLTSSKSIGSKYPISTFSISIVLFLSIMLIPGERHYQLLVPSIALGLALGAQFKKIDFKFHQIDVVFFTMMCYWLLLSLFKVNTSFGFYRIASWMFCYLLYIVVRTDRQVVKQIPLIAFSIAAIVCCVIFITHLSSLSSMDSLFSIEKVIHAQSFNRNDNYVISVLTVLLPYLFYSFDHKFLKYAKYIITPLAIITIFISTSSLNKILALLVCIYFIGLYANLRFKLSRRLILLGSIGVILLLTIVYFSTNLVNLEHRGMNERFDLWSSTWLVIKNNLLTGVGHNNWHIFIEQYVNIRTVITHPHNFFIELISETGLIGFSLFLFLIIKFIIRIFRKESSFTKLENIALVSLAIYVIQLNIYGVLTPHYNQQSSPLAIAFMNLAVFRYNNKPILHSINKYLILGLTLLIVAYSAYIFYKSRNFIKIMNTTVGSTRIEQLDKLYNPYLYTHISLKHSLSTRIAKKMKNNQTIIFHQKELVNQYPFTPKHKIKLVKYYISKKRYKEALDTLLVLKNHEYDKLEYELLLAETYYLNKKKQEGDEILFKFRDLEIPSMQQVKSIEEINEVISLKMDALNLYNKYNSKNK